MAYQPIGQTKKTGGYVSISKNKPPLSQQLDSRFPSREIIRNVSQAMTPIQTPTVKPTVGELAREIFIPKRGFEDGEVAQAKPTVKESAVGTAKAVGEIGVGLASLSSMGMRQVPGLRRLAGDKDVLDSYQERLLPKTAGEAKAMRVADIVGFAAGPIKASRFGSIRKALIAVKDPEDAVKLLRSADLPEDVIRRLNLDTAAVRITNTKQADAFINQVSNVARGTATSATPSASRTGLFDIQRTPSNLPPLPKLPQITPKVSRATTPDIPTRTNTSPAPSSVTPTRTELPKTKTQITRELTQGKLDEAEYINREVMPTGQPKSTRLIPSKYLDTVEAFIDVARGTSKLSKQEKLDVQQRVQDIADAIGLPSSTKSNKALADDFERVLQDRAYEESLLTRRTPPPNKKLDNFLSGKPSSQGGYVANPLTKAVPGQSSASRQGVSSPNDSTLPVLPKLPEDVRRGLSQQETDRTINEAVLTRYRQANTRTPKGDTKLAAGAKKATTTDGFMKLASELATPISSRLMRINPKLKKAIRQFEFNVASQTTKDARAVLPLLKASQKMSKEDRVIFDLARKNQDTEVIDALAKRYGIEKELAETRRVLDEMFERAKEVGMEVGYRGEYHPRMIINPEKYMGYLRGQEDWGTIQKLIETEATKKGRKYTDLTDEEKASLVNNFIRGYGNKTVLAAPSNTKARTIEVIDDTLNEFYETSDSALSAYIIRMNDEIEGRRFFGKNLKAEIGDADIQDSIGHYVMKLVADGEIKPTQEKEVSDIFKARFHRGKMNGALDVYRNLEYMSTMGSPISAVTQLGDLAFPLFDNGFYHTSRGLSKALFSKNKLTKEDLGIENITQEFTKNTVSGRMLDRVFRAVGLEKMDRLGKETLVNGYLSKLQSQAKRGDDVLRREMDFMFDVDEATLAMDELAKGVISERTKLLAFNRLLDFQPVAKSEMPQKYLEMPNGRIFYMLKSFTLKQYDVFRREAVDHIVSGDPKRVRKGMKNLLFLSGAFMAANATADEIKDLILGRETPPSDKLVDNLWRLVGASKYDVYKARSEGVARTVQAKILFPTSIIDRAGKDVVNISTEKEYQIGPLAGERFDLESTQTIPGLGKLYYWWFGRGAQKEQYNNSDTTVPGLPKLPKLPSAGTPDLPKLPKLPSL